MPFTDTFTDINGKELKDHTPSGGTAWTQKLGTSSSVTIQSNECSCGLTEPPQTLWCDDQGSKDCYTQYVVKNTNNFGIPACLRMTSAANPTYIGIRVRSNLVSIIKNTGGSFATLGTGSTTVSVDDSARIEADEDDIKALLDTGSGFVDEITGIVETLNNTVTQQGTAPKNSGLSFDNYEAGVLAVGVLLPLIGSGGLIGPSMLIGDRSGLIG